MPRPFSLQCACTQSAHAPIGACAVIDFHIFDSIRILGAPQGEEREIEEIIGPMQSAVERGQKKLVPVSSVAQVSTLFGEYNRRARQYGLDDCLVDESHLKKLEV